MQDKQSFLANGMRPGIQSRVVDLANAYVARRISSNLSRRSFNEAGYELSLNQLFLVPL